MTTLAYMPIQGISTTSLREADDWFGVGSSEVYENLPARRSPVSRTHTVATIADNAAEDNEWIERTLPFLQRIADLPHDWDSLGSPKPCNRVITAAMHLLKRLQNSRLGAIPVPFVSPIAGGGIQLEWDSSQKHLEIEVLNSMNVVFLMEEHGETECGEFALAEVERVRRLLDRFAAA